MALARDVISLVLFSITFILKLKRTKVLIKVRPYIYLATLNNISRALARGVNSIILFII